MTALFESFKSSTFLHLPGLGKLVGSMCAVSGVLVLSLPIPIIAGNFETFHKNMQRMNKAEKAKKKLEDAKDVEERLRIQFCQNKSTQVNKYKLFP